MLVLRLCAQHDDVTKWKIENIVATTKVSYDLADTGS